MRLLETFNLVRRKMLNGDLIKRNGRPYSEKSIGFYNNVMHILLEHMEDFELPSVPSGVAHRTFMGEWATALRKSLRSTGIGDSTENAYMDTVKLVFNRIDEFYGIRLDVSSPAFRKLPVEDRMLVPEHGRIIEMVRTFRPKTKGQQDAFKYITAAAVTGARVSDLRNWNRQEHIETVDGKEYLSYVPSKSPDGKRIILPVAGPLEGLFGHHKLLPDVPYQTLRSNVKRVFCAAGFRRKVKRTITKGGEKKVREFEEWEIMGLHRLRASAITGMLQSGMSEAEAKSFSGHSSDSRSFRRYVDLDRKHLEGKFNGFAGRF